MSKNKKSEYNRHDDLDSDIGSMRSNDRFSRTENVRKN